MSVTVESGLLLFFKSSLPLPCYLSLYQPKVLTLFVTEREPGDVRAAHLLVEDLWGRPRLRAELSDLLKLEVAEVRVSAEEQNGPRSGVPSKQALLMFQVYTSRSSSESLRGRRTADRSRVIGMAGQSDISGRR